MCGRYYFHLDVNHPEVEELKKSIQQYQLFDYASGEVFPTQKALILRKEQKQIRPDVKPWGMHGYRGQLIINARMEGIENKRTFAPYLHNRCVIPCCGFYEWVKHGTKKDKIYITRNQRPLLYMAGFYNRQHEFVIVTGAAEHQMRTVHARTPILFDREQAELYLNGELAFLVDNENLIFQKQ